MQQKPRYTSLLANGSQSARYPRRSAPPGGLGQPGGSQNGFSESWSQSLALSIMLTGASPCRRTPHPQNDPQKAQGYKAVSGISRISKAHQQHTLFHLPSCVASWDRIEKPQQALLTHGHADTRTRWFRAAACATLGCRGQGQVPTCSFLVPGFEQSQN